MKKSSITILLTLTLCSATILSGCITQTPSGVSEENAYTTETTDTGSANHADLSDESSSYSCSNTLYGITVTEEKKSSSFTVKDHPDVTALTATAVYPQISIEDNPEAAGRINSAILSEFNTFWNFETEHAVTAEEEYLMSLDSTETAVPPGYTGDFSYELKRCDDKIISVVFTQSDYTGGAHGNVWSYGVTFDAATGERLYLESLSEDNAKFYRNILDFLNEQAMLPVYQEQYLFDGVDADIEGSLLSDSACWYFDRSGMSFISNPYVLGPYAAGTFEFHVPYESLTGLKKAYGYKGNYIRKLFPGVSAIRDINSDASDDEICYSVQSDDGVGGKPSLIINHKDFTAQLDKLSLSFLWTGAYYLMDIDSEDAYTEIAISSENPENESETRTHFFRYDTKGNLVYLGNTPGVFNENMQVRYNSNGNLILCDRSGDPAA